MNDTASFGYGMNGPGINQQQQQQAQQQTQQQQGAINMRAMLNGMAKRGGIVPMAGYPDSMFPPGMVGMNVAGNPLGNAALPVNKVDSGTPLNVMMNHNGSSAKNTLPESQLATNSRQLLDQLASGGTGSTPLTVDQSIPAMNIIGNNLASNPSNMGPLNHEVLPNVMPENSGSNANNNTLLEVLNGPNGRQRPSIPHPTQQAAITENANNPLFHPHLEDSSLLNNPIWKLQLNLAYISAQSLGQPNVYARQSAMKRFYSSQNVPLQSNQISGASNSLVDFTKQSLIEMMTADESKTTSNSNLGHGSSAPMGVSSNTKDSTNSSMPSTPKSEAQLMREQSTNTPSLLLQHKKLSQFSIDEDDEVENRMTNTNAEAKHDDQLWHAIDLSNLQIFNISHNLFKYTFLTRLYLNGNALTELPKEIKKLNNLRVLDLSHNRLQNLPNELGACYQLKYLYLFNNMITSFPWEMGNLCSLQFLGCEGNPLDKQQLKILTEKSVTGLIFYLRDNRPEVPLLKDREFIEINADGEVQNKYNSLKDANLNLNDDLKNRSFTLMSYNTLCQHYATPKMYRYTPSWALTWEYRRDKLTQQILSYNCDVFCLLEVECKTFEDYWQPMMEKEGYSSAFHAKTRSKTMQGLESKKVDGCCLFYRNSKFRMIRKELIDFNSLWMKHKKFERTEDYLNRAMNKDNVALCMKLQHLKTNESVWVATTHLHWDPKFNDVKTFQVSVLLDYLENTLKDDSPRQDFKKIPLIICGDLNSYKDSAVYELLSTGRVVVHTDKVPRDYGYMSTKNFMHSLALKSSYSCIGELPFTNFTPSFTDVIDYIWFSSHALRVRGVLGEVDPEYISHFIGFPNDKFPSDHIPLISRFEFVKSNTGGSRKI